jgi:hypothetical protein
MRRSWVKPCRPLPTGILLKPYVINSVGLLFKCSGIYIYFVNPRDIWIYTPHFDTITMGSGAYALDPFSRQLNHLITLNKFNAING